MNIVDLYNKNKTKKIYRLDGSYIKETHGIKYLFPIMMMKYGLFGTQPNFLNTTIYQYIARKIYCLANRKFKSDKECKEKITEFILDNHFTKSQLKEILHPNLTTTHYPTLNAFFSRPINLKLRNNHFIERAFYSPADSRTKFIKSDGRKFNIKGLDIMLDDIGFIPSKCSLIMISRLVPSDYHRFHSPVGGKILSIKEIKTQINLSVNEMVMPEFNPYALNSRKIITIQSQYIVLEMAFIGASFVSDIVINKKIGEYLMIGEEIGYFRLGSCIVSKLSNVMLDCRIKIDQEYYLETRQQIGRFIQDT